MWGDGHHHWDSAFLGLGKRGIDVRESSLILKGRSLKSQEKKGGHCHAGHACAECIKEGHTGPMQRGFIQSTS